ncbi:hypothetical protein EES41_35380 [Streptomyces sp. ADI95-16]|nr:hypothetical protein EES41_35380 [Streptomyces sp. ADI95-16]
MGRALGGEQECDRDLEGADGNVRVAASTVSATERRRYSLTSRTPTSTAAEPDPDAVLPLVMNFRAAPEPHDHLCFLLDDRRI